MNAYIDDNRPFFRQAKGIAQKIEEKRMQFNQDRNKTREGTLKGLEDLIAKRKAEVANAK